MTPTLVPAWEAPRALRAPSPSRRGRPLLRVYWALVGAAAFGLVYKAPDVPTESVTGAAAITAAALLPSYFWCAGRIGGLPVLPVYAVTFLWTFALPLVTGHPGVLRYPPSDHLVAGVVVAGFLLLATLVSVYFGRVPPRKPRVMLVLDGSRAVPWLIASLGLDAAYGVVGQAHWLVIDGDINSVVAAAFGGVTTVASFILPYLWSRGELRGKALWFAVVLFAADSIVGLTGFLLIGVLSKAAAGLVGMTLGGRRPRLVPFAMLAVLVVPLHYGKHQMRDRYWRGERAGQPVRPVDYPELFAEWYAFSAEGISRGEADSHGESFTARSSLVHLFLLARERQANGVEPLRGAGYALIPSLLVPRLLDPDKPASHEGTYLLNINYGLQTRKDTFTTTIGWGLFNEAFGNFGYAGLCGLALVLGGTVGCYARWTHGAPELSVRFLVAVLVLAEAFQTEHSAGVVVTVLFQFTIALVGLCILLGARRRLVR